MATATITTMTKVGFVMSEGQCRLPPLALLRLQAWLSPAFPTGSYSYSHGLEWAAEAGHIPDRESLVDWLEADLCFGSGRNEAILFNEAWRCAIDDDRAKRLKIREQCEENRAGARPSHTGR
jgi:urease accessory protein